MDDIFELIQFSTLSRLTHHLNSYPKSVLQRDSNGMTPLHIVSSLGEVDMVKLFLRTPIDINLKNNLGFTPIHCAVLHSNLNVIRELIKKKADLEIPSNDGWTPFHSAAQIGNLDVVELLTNNGVDMNKANVLGLSALHLAVSRGNLNTVKYLINNGAGFKQPNGDYSPLHVAALVGQFECVEFLIDMGADINLENGQGNTPLHLAALEGEVKIVEYLIKKECDCLWINDNDKLASEVASDECRIILEKQEVLQVMRDKSSYDMFNFGIAFLENRMIPVEILILILECIQRGFTKQELILISRVVLDKNLVVKLSTPTLASYFMAECRALSIYN